MPNAEEEARWRAEFEKDGERLVHDTIYHGFDCYPEPKRQFAFRWLRIGKLRTTSKSSKRAAMFDGPFGRRGDCWYYRAAGDMVLALD